MSRVVGRDAKIILRRLNIPLLVFSVLFLAIGILSLGILSRSLSFGCIAIGFITLGYSFAIHLLPSVAFVLFAFIPLAYLPIDSGFPRGTVTPAVLIIGIWTLRLLSSRTERLRNSVLRVAGAATFVVLIGLSLSGRNPVYSLLWTLVFALLIVVPGVLLQKISFETIQALRATWQGTALILSLFAFIETLSHWNPIAGFYTVDQHWSVHRVMTTLGHPLMNGVFFAMSAVYFALLAIRRRRWGAGIVALCAAMATAFSGSRSGVIALFVGLCAGLFLLLFKSKVSAGTKIFGLAISGGGGVVVWLNPVLQERLGSAEAAGSSAYRDSYAIADAWTLFHQEKMLGIGPGLGIRTVFDSTGFLLENAAIGSLIGLGVIGAASVLIYLALLLLLCIGRGGIEVLATVAAFLVLGFAFPLWESIPASMIMVTFALILIPSTAHFGGKQSSFAVDFVPSKRPDLSSERFDDQFPSTLRQTKAEAFERAMIGPMVRVKVKAADA